MDWVVYIPIAFICIPMLFSVYAIFKYIYDKLKANKQKKYNKSVGCHKTNTPTKPSLDISLLKKQLELLKQYKKEVALYISLQELKQKHTIPKKYQDILFTENKIFLLEKNELISSAILEINDNSNKEYTTEYVKLLEDKIEHLHRQLQKLESAVTNKRMKTIQSIKDGNLDILSKMLDIDKEYQTKKECLILDCTYRISAKRHAKNALLIAIAAPLICLFLLLTGITNNFLANHPYYENPFLLYTLGYLIAFGIVFLLLRAPVNSRFNKYEVECNKNLEQYEKTLLSIYSQKQQDTVSNIPIDLIIGAPEGTVFEGGVPADSRYDVYLSYNGTHYHQRLGCSNSFRIVNVFSIIDQYEPCSRCMAYDYSHILPWRKKYYTLRGLKHTYNLTISGDSSTSSTAHPSLVDKCNACKLNKYLSTIETLTEKNYKPKLPKPKLLPMMISLVAVIIALMFIINAVFFRYEEPQYGANTICYTNSLNKDYHTQYCSYLLNNRVKLPLYRAIASGYEECVSCTVSDSIHNTCYTTTYGDCYHSAYCKHLWNSSYSTTVYNAIRNGKQGCSDCDINADLDINCYIYPYGDDCFHTLTCSQSATEEVKTKKTTVKKAQEDYYGDCPHCDIGTLDTSYKGVNSFGESLLISFGVVITTAWLLLWVYIAVCNIKLKKLIPQLTFP